MQPRHWPRNSYGTCPINRGLNMWKMTDPRTIEHLSCQQNLDSPRDAQDAWEVA